MVILLTQSSLTDLTEDVPQALDALSYCFGMAIESFSSLCCIISIDIEGRVIDLSIERGPRRR